MPLLGSPHAYALHPSSSFLPSALFRSRRAFLPSTIHPRPPFRRRLASRPRRWASRTLEGDTTKGRDKYRGSLRRSVDRPRLLFRRFVVESCRSPSSSVPDSLLFSPPSLPSRYTRASLHLSPVYTFCCALVGYREGIQRSGCLARLAAAAAHSPKPAADDRSVASLRPQLAAQATDDTPWMRVRADALRQRQQRRSRIYVLLQPSARHYEPARGPRTVSLRASKGLAIGRSPCSAALLSRGAYPLTRLTSRRLVRAKKTELIVEQR
jgi:hypothetical protein